MPADREFRERVWGAEPPRPRDVRDEYHRDRARITHSAAFRRLQAKTQVMGIGEGDFHRTRLTHSIEASQIGEGVREVLMAVRAKDSEAGKWLPSRDLVIAACYAHDLGHPPYGHGGEIALHSRMIDRGGFEGNAHTLRILTRLEKYSIGKGINPTRRLVLAVLKYPMPFSSFDPGSHMAKPPKCYFDEERSIVDWALGAPFTASEKTKFTTEKHEDGKPAHRTLDCSLMECADDIAYAVHDLEDIVARRLVRPEDVISRLEHALEETSFGPKDREVRLQDFSTSLFATDHGIRKAFIGRLVHLLVSTVQLREEPGFSHPLLKFRVEFSPSVVKLLRALKALTFDLVVSRPEVQQLERRGRRIVDSLFSELLCDPEGLIPHESLSALPDKSNVERCVCDYIAGMTDPYAEKIYRRLFVPGFGSSRDEL